MKSLGQLVAGVAHELNNPIGFVHANLQLLDEYIQKLVDGPAHRRRHRTHARGDHQAAGAQPRGHASASRRSCRTCAPSRAWTRPTLQDADLHEEIERTLALMEPRFKNAINVERDYGDLAARALLPRPAEPGLPEPADERLRRDRQAGERSASARAAAATACGSSSTTTAPASPRSSRASSTRSSPPSRSASARASASRSRTASSSATAAASASSPSRGTARRS